MSDKSAWSMFKPFLTGSMSGIVATCCVQPIDMVKVRIQLNAGSGGSTSPVTVASSLIKQDGFLSLYRGLSAGLLRQVVYTGARLGLFDSFMEKARGGKKDAKVGFVMTGACSMSAGGIAAIIGCPADLALIRMQADSMLPEAERRGYRHVGHALSSIVKADGVTGIFAGWMPTATRAMALNFGMLAFNSKSKDLLADMGCKKEGAVQIFGASAIAGFFASFFSLPFDYVKTQVQKMKPDPVTGEMPFKGPVDCALKTVKEGGVTRLWAGFPTFYIRIAPHAMITLIAQSQVKKMWASMGL